MFKENLIKSGWLHALFIAVIAYPLGAVSASLLATVMQTNILVYSVVFTISAAVALLLRAGPGKLGLNTLKSYQTWLYALLQISVLIFGILIMKYVSATEGAGLYRVTGLVAVFLSYIFLAQKTNSFELAGSLLILAGFGSIIYYTDISFSIQLLLIFFVLARALSQSLQKLIVEIHKTNNQAKSSKDEARVIGFILAISGVLMLFVLLIVAYIKQNYSIALFAKFPNYSDFADLKGFSMAIFMGFCIVSISKYCEFYAGKTIGAKYLTTLLSLQIIFVYFIEQVLAYFGLMNPVGFVFNDYIAVGLILSGNFIISLSGFIKDFNFNQKAVKIKSG